ncbi:DUF488 domain-containing protein [Carnimonas nigrificans]|uniref:DUF488 domain-containing protein n=1 Tax=Carnimonas nigrificans TaxID=64323 RepID=UPI0004BB87CF|nr:DUF488 domain-containing protein [Carnimonas nigrificans]
MTHIQLKRAYTVPEQSDGQRILVDRLWPRGKSKEQEQLTAWLKEIAPSTELRKWFGHKAEHWQEFKAKYRAELEANPTAIQELSRYLDQGKVTLLYGAKDEQHNQAVVIKEYMEHVS